ncbi:MAG: hypothetical protein KAT16_05120 [Candidatus Heimdallarchaeota archaeon]|nr:hypothetical protein [Candidatus Heimdallarchaeota archaeon]
MKKKLLEIKVEIQQILDLMVKNLGSLKYVFLAFIILHIVLGAIVTPLFSSDFERNIFYGEAFWEHGFQVYDLTPLEIDPNYSIGDPTSGILAYENTTYDYPTIQLLFWAGMVLLPFPQITIKWVLSFFDVLNCVMLFMLLKRYSPEDGENKEMKEFEKIFLLGYLLFAIPFSAIEGQSTSITIFFLFLPLVLYTYKQQASYLAIGLGFHWKYVSFLVLPYIVFRDYKYWKKMVTGIAVLICTIILLSFPLFWSNFILAFFGAFGNLKVYSGQIPSNPLLLSEFYLSSIISSGILLLGIFLWLKPISDNKKISFDVQGIIQRAYWLPLLILLSFLKIYSTAFPWYWLWFYPLLAILPEKERRIFTLLFIVTFAIGTIDFIDMTVGFDTFIGYVT